MHQNWIWIMLSKFINYLVNVFRMMNKNWAIMKLLNLWCCIQYKILNDCHLEPILQLWKTVVTIIYIET